MLEIEMKEEEETNRKPFYIGPCTISLIVAGFGLDQLFNYLFGANVMLSL